MNHEERKTKNQKQYRGINPYIKTVKGVIMFIVTLFLLICLMSCSASWHINRAIKKDPSILDTTRVVKRDTVIVPVTSVDTLFKLQRDTLVQYIQKDSLDKEVIIKYRYNTVTDSVFIEVDCPDCNEMTTTITETVTIKPTLRDFFKKYWWIFGIVVILPLFYKR